MQDNLTDDEIHTSINQGSVKKRPMSYCTTIIISIPFAVAVIIACAAMAMLTMLIVFMVMGIYTEATPVYVVKNFNGYSITFDIANLRPVNSTIFAWSINKPPRGGWATDSLTRIDAADYSEFSRKFCTSSSTLGMDRGHLSPFADLGKESMTILNIVPQYACHNQGLWKHFEMHVRTNYRGFNITTTAHYDDPSYFLALLRGARLYIPTRLCKTILGVQYCIPHTCDACNLSWCCAIVPRIASVPCVGNPTCVSM